MLRYRYTLFFILTVLSGILIFIQVLFSSLPFNPTRAKADVRKAVFTFLPQGWAFFTRSPREAQVVLYGVSDAELTPITHKHTSYSNFFGLSRRSTRIMYELQYFKQTIPDSAYINTEWNYQRDLYGDIPQESVVIENDYQDPVLCGEYLLVFQEQVPWAWLGSIDEIKMPAKAIKLSIQCQN